MKSSTSFSFSQACKYLSLSSTVFTALRDAGLIATVQDRYEKTSLEISRRLLEIGTLRSWDVSTLAWYADLLFAANLGRSVFLPLREPIYAETQAGETWLASPEYTSAILQTLNDGESYCDRIIVTPLASLIAQEVGKELFWLDIEALAASSLSPVISYLETQGTRLLDNESDYRRDVGIVYVAMMLTFKVVALPLSTEFGELVRKAQNNVKRIGQRTVAEEEQSIIRNETLIAVDKLYASKATEIHSPVPFHEWERNVSVIRAQKRTVVIQQRLPDNSDGDLIDNILDIVRPFLGLFGARVVHLLYEIANDAPYFRNPVITVNTNEMLDRLGMTRDVRGIHQSRNRERLRDALNAANQLEIVGEYTVWEDKELTRKAFQRTVLSILGASFSAQENRSLATAELFSKGLPKSVQIRLNFYDGVRRPDGLLGSQFVLLPHLPNPNKLSNASRTGASEPLRSYLLFCYRQTRSRHRKFSVTRRLALEKSGITNKNVTRATFTLTKALSKLVNDGVLEAFTPIPLDPDDTFEVTLSHEFVSLLRAD